MIEFHYRLEIGSKYVYLDNENRAITLESRRYTPMDFGMAEKVINEIGKDVIKVYEVKKTYTERENQVDIREFSK